MRIFPKEYFTVSFRVGGQRKSFKGTLKASTLVLLHCERYSPRIVQLVVEQLQREAQRTATAKLKSETHKACSNSIPIARNAATQLTYPHNSRDFWKHIDEGPFKEWTELFQHSSVVVSQDSTCVRLACMLSKCCIKWVSWFYLNAASLFHWKRHMKFYFCVIQKGKSLQGRVIPTFIFKIQWFLIIFIRYIWCRQEVCKTCPPRVQQNVCWCCETWPPNLRGWQGLAAMLQQQQLWPRIGHSPLCQVRWRSGNRPCGWLQFLIELFVCCDMLSTISFSPIIFVNPVLI